MQMLNKGASLPNNSNKILAEGHVKNIYCCLVVFFFHLVGIAEWDYGF